MAARHSRREVERMTQRRRLTIKEVAEAAGVSTQTVSRVLNNRPDVSPETYDRVKQIITDTGYAPNMMARSLTQGRSHILGVVAYGLEYFGPSRVLTGIEQQAADMGYAISLNLIHEPATNDVDGLLSSLFSRQVDGIIWAIPEVGTNRVWSHGRDPDFPVPVMLVGGMDGQTTLPSIGIDNVAIGRLATEHLLAGGARKVAIVTGPLAWWEAQQRQSGWRATLRAHGLDASDDLVAVGDWTANSGEQALARLLEADPDIDAMFASNDQMALGVLHGAHRLGRRIPEDLSVIGVDNIAEASHFWPSLSTVGQPLRDAGALAVRDIDASIRRAIAPRRAVEAPTAGITLLEPALIVRDSSRPVGPS
jgi:DNA-binding LacI/PurR family transcriptional regulator